MSNLELILEKPADHWTADDLDVIAKVCNLQEPRYPFKDWCRSRAKKSFASGYRDAKSGELVLTRDGRRTYVMRPDGARYFGLLMQRNRSRAIAA